MSVQFIVDGPSDAEKLTIIITERAEIEVLTVPGCSVFPEQHFPSHQIFIIPLSEGVYVEIDGVRKEVTPDNQRVIRPDCHFVIGHYAKKKPKTSIRVLMIRVVFPEEEITPEQP